MARALSLDLRKRVVDAIARGMSCRQAAARFGVSASSAIRWAAQIRSGGALEPKTQGGVFMCKLRKKLANASNGRNYIETVWGRGYVLREPDVDTGLPGFLVLDARTNVEPCKPK